MGLLFLDYLRLIGFLVKAQLLFKFTRSIVKAQLGRFGFFLSGWCGHNGESSLSFCNGLGTIYIASSRGMTFFILLLEIWVRSLGMVLGRC